MIITVLGVIVIIGGGEEGEDVTNHTANLQKTLE